MRRLSTTILIAVAATAAWCDTVRMGALSTDTTVETLGEGAAAVQLVSKAKIDSMIETLSVGSDGTWLELNGSTGTIYQLVWMAGVVGETNKLVVSGVSGEGYNGPALGSEFVFDIITMRLFINGHMTTVPCLAVYDSYKILGLSTNLTGVFYGYNKGTVLWKSKAANPGYSTFPQTFTAIEGTGGVGSFTLDWYGISTNVYQIALVDDLPDLSGYATTGAVAAVAATIPDVAASTNWLTRAGLSGTVAFANDGGRPQAWNGSGALTVSGFSGMTPPSQVYWTLYGFDSVTLPASAYVVGGGAWQTNMVNHFTVWQVGTNVMLNFITATEAD